MTLRAHVPLGPRAVDEWSDVLRDELGPDLWRLQGRVVLRGDARPVDCVGMRSFVSGSPGRDAGAGPISTVTILGRDLPAHRIVAAFRSTVAD